MSDSAIDSTNLQSESETDNTVNNTENSEETTPETSETQATEKTSEDVDTVPFHKHPRWQELMKERKESRDREREKDSKIFELENENKKLKSRPITDEDLEGKTPAEIRKIIEEQMRSEMEYNNLIREREEKEADEYVENTLQDLKDAWFEFNENKLLKLSVDYTKGDILKAFELYQKLETTEKKSEQNALSRAEKLKNSESNNSNKKSVPPSWFTRGMSWNDVRSQMS